MTDPEGELAARDAVLSAMNDGVLLLDPAGRLMYANRAAHAVLRRSVQATSEVSARSVLDAIRDLRADSVPGRGDPVTRQFETGDAVVEATLLPADPPGTVAVVVRDVTSARRVDRLRRDFVANASHELKTPVASILALSGVLRAAADDDPAAVVRFLPRLEREAERLAALVSDLLELSRLEVGTSARAEVRLDLVLRAEAERVRARAEGAGLRLRVEASAPVAVLGAESDLAHLVHNLLDNAVRYTPAGGEIETVVRRDDGGAELIIRDTGIGIPGADLDRIFERFYRVDVARSRGTGGTGLGLSIARNVAEAHGGAVTVRSVLGAGSTFTVRLPLLPDRGAAAGRAAGAAHLPGGADDPTAARRPNQ